MIAQPRLRLSALLVAAYLLAAACKSSDESPPTSPLAESPTAAATVAPSSSPSRTPTAVATATPGGGATPSAAELESAVGTSITLMGEWLGIPETDLAIEEADAVVWPDSCLGVQRPDIACADVLTPGFRVSLADALGHRHTIHADTSGSFTWVGEERIEGDLAGLAVGSGVLTVRIDGAERSFRLLPGTDLGADGAPLTAADAGARVVVAFDEPPNEGEPVVAWAARAEDQ
jgi:hypothetical protein